MKFRVKPFDPTGASHSPGDLVQVPGGGWRVRSHRGEWLPVAAPPDPSCAGPPGRDGRDGRSGVDGADGAPGVDGQSIRWMGPHKRGRVYHPGEAVSLAGDSWIAVANTNVRPGRTKSWQLLAAKGDQGDQGEPGATYYSSSVRRVTESMSKMPMGFSESVAFGDVVRIPGDNVAAKALAHGSDAAAMAIGLVSGAGEIQTSGPFFNEAWNLTPGVPYYLSPSVPGAITDIYPTTLGDYVVIVGFAADHKTLIINIHHALYVGT